MKNYIASSFAALALLGSAAVADDFDNNTAQVTLQKDRLEFTAAYDEADGFDKFEVMYEVHSGFIGNLPTWSKVGAFYFDETETVGLAADFEVWKQFRTRDYLYAGAKATYVVDSSIEELKEQAEITPRLGYELGLTDEVALFTEVGYTFDLDDGLDEVAGYAELGAIFDNGSVEVKPSLIQEFDTEDEALNANLSLKVRF